ncbi:MAG: hypothetical protein LH478_14925 [Chitinophagaceae bacterium]|nr:hypothetical protein [Chitinophagaceae bacterium]
MRVVLMLACILLAFPVFAQPRKIYVVRAGEIPNEVLLIDAIYSFPHFKKGIVFLGDGSATSQQLNYNLLLDEMHFINANNNTLAIATPETIKSVVFDSTSFYFDKNYLQVVLEEGEIKLAIKQFLVQSPYRTRGAYDVSSFVSSISTYSSTYSNGHLSKLQIKKDVEMEKKSLFFVSDRFNHFYPAEKKFFYKVFPNKKAELDSYLKENHINFYDKNALVSLIKLCSV